MISNSFFDSIWLQDSMLCLWSAGVQDELFYLVYKLNEHAKIKIFTPVGETRMLEVDDKGSKELL